MDKSLELMRHGSLPDFNDSHQRFGPFTKRARNVVRQVTGCEPLSQKWCGEYVRGAHDQTVCRRCRKSPARRFYWNSQNDSFQVTWSDPPTTEELETIVPFCTEQCRSDYITCPVCPDCGAWERRLLRQEEGDSVWPNVEGMVAYGKASTAVLDLERQALSLKGSEKDEAEKRLEGLRAEKERLESSTYLPMVVCRQCNVGCEPRSPYRAA